MKRNKNRLFWIITSAVCGFFLVVLIVLNIVGAAYATTINWFFNSSGGTYQVSGGGEIYFKSDYTKKDASGKTQLDAKGKEVYDSAALEKAGDELVKEVAGEGFVLISNNGALPLAENTTVSLFGQSVDNPVTSGTGSGATTGTNATYVSSLKAGNLKVNEDSYNFYATGDIAKNYKLAVPGMHDDNPFRINECPWDTVKSSSSYQKMISCDTALVVFSRNGGEGYDLSNGVSDVGYDFGEIHVADGRTIAEGSLTGDNYLELNGAERGVLAGLKSLKDAGTIKNIVVVLNSANAIQLDFLNKDLCGADYGIDACLWIGATGQSGLDALGSILSGKINPSGHLVDTYCYDNLKEPSIYNFGHNAYANYESDYRAKANAEDKLAYMSEKFYNVYREGIYVGYRYYETRYEDYVLGTGNAGNFDYANTVAYSFGHGLSYSEFKYSNFSVSEEGSKMSVTVTVTNTSDIPGKEVVEVYAQTPYTDYDKQKNIEKSAVELVGFEKTKLLAKGESETVTVTFDKELLAAYDAYGYKTYIMDAGDYYLTVGNGAHDALNNILEAKNADKSKMTGAPAEINADGEIVYTWNEAQLDSTTYSKSSSTQADITNRFDNADLNLYDNGSQKIQYVTRSDWNGSFDCSSLAAMKSTFVSLNMTDKMYEEVRPEVYTAPAEAANAKMPAVDKDNGLKLVMFRGVPLDGSITRNGKTYTWDDLLDQLSLKNMRDLIAEGQHTTKVIPSVSKPATSDQNGPSGFSSSFVGGGKGTAYPAPCIRAATWNKELVNRVGKMIGEDGLHSGCNGLYGPAANIHRNAYCGRNFEYYSEDPVVSGNIAAQEVRGIQSKGIIVYMKHFALNDSETHREGVCTWANEQAIREIYLEAFRNACKKDDGNCHAIMSGFNRFGTEWCGNSDNLMNKVLRGEWGFDGFIVTDADACDTTTHCTIYMYAPRAVTSGTDIFDGVNNHDRKSQLSAYSKDAYVVSCMRESAKRILYSVANSAAMNGIGANSQITETLPAWQAAAVALAVVFAVFTAVSVVMLILNLKKVINFPFKNKEED